MPMQVLAPDPQTGAAITALAHIIQLAVAPVFLLSGVAGFLAVLTNRLSRIIDRTRTLESDHAIASGHMSKPSPQETPTLVGAELRVLRDRARLINRAITLCTLCALLVASVVAVLFLGAFFKPVFSIIVAPIFIAAMLALVAGLLSFLHEIHLATKHMREATRWA